MCVCIGGGGGGGGVVCRGSTREFEEEPSGSILGASWVETS